MKRYQKILLGVVITAVVIIGGIQLYFSFSLDRQIKETLTTRFHEATNNAYELQIGDFDLEILGRQLNLSNITLTQKKKTGSTDIQATLDELNVSGIGFFKLFWDRELSLREIELVNPKIAITVSQAKSDSSNDQTSLHSLSRRLSSITLQVLDNVIIPSFQIHGLAIDYNHTDFPVDPYLSFNNSYIHLHNIKIDSTTVNDNRIIPSDNITITLRNIRHHTSNELYDLSAEQLDISSATHSMDLRSLRLNPRLDKQQFTKRMDYETDQITMGIDQISWEKINFEKLNHGEGLTVKSIHINQPDIDIYRDKRPPFPPNNNPPLPQQMIRNIPFPIDIDSLLISDGNIRYSEWQPRADTSGYIEFTDLSATFRHLTNIQEQWSSDPPPTLTAETKIMGTAKLEANFTFPMESQNQHIKGRLGSMDMKPLNEALVPLAFVKIDEGRILGMDFEMDLNKQRSSGSVLLNYENLKISLLDRESNKETFGNKVASLLANTFKVKSDNTGDDPRVGKVEFERDDNKSVFNYWWKSLLSGLKSSIGA